MARYASRRIPTTKPLDRIYNEYKRNFTSDAYGKWPDQYRNQMQRHEIERSATQAKPRYESPSNIELYSLYSELRGKGSPEQRPESEGERNEQQAPEIDAQELAEIISERIESLREFSEQDTPRMLPTLDLGDKTYFLDTRLWELRNVTDPSDRIDLRELEFGPNLTAQEYENDQQERIAEAPEISAPKVEQYANETTQPTENIENQGSPEYHKDRLADIIETEQAYTMRKKPHSDAEIGW